MTLTGPQVAALYAMRQNAPLTIREAKDVPALPGLIRAQSDDGRAWLISREGGATRIPEFSS